MGHDLRYETLNTENAALLLVDHQVGTMNFGLTDLDALHLKNNTLWLAEAAKLFKLPVLLTTSNAQGANGPLFPELIAALPGVPVVNRFIINAWNDPAFHDAVKKLGRKKLIIAGVTADVCLTFPSISAVRDGYDVYAVLDASGTVNAQALMATSQRMTQAGVKLANTNMVIAEILADWSSPLGAPMAELYAKHLPNFGFIAAQRASVQTAAPRKN